MVGGGGDSLHFCMCRNIGESFHKVVRTGNDAVFADHHRAHRHFVAAKRRLCLIEGFLHEIFVGHGDKSFPEVPDNPDVPELPEYLGYRSNGS